MKILQRLFLAVVVIAAIPATIYAKKPAPAKYKCMIQMTNYVGEGAYIVVSLIDPKGGYEKTLRVMGSDKKWYKDVKEWYKSYAKKPTNISAITGASVSGGDRCVTVLEIDDAKLDAGYKIRFETAVEDKEYYVKDLEIPLTKEAISGKTDGTNYIRYVRFSAN
jgi:hypothetical protein